MDRHDAKLAALLAVYHASVFALAFAVGYGLTVWTGSLLAGLASFAAIAWFAPRLDSML